MGVGVIGKLMSTATKFREAEPSGKGLSYENT